MGADFTKKLGKIFAIIEGMENKENCIFCQIIEGKQEADMVFENDQFVVFKDINPKAPVHVLLVPRGHIEDMDKADDEVLSGMIKLAKELAIDWQLEHFKVQVNKGRKAGQVVDHLHMHLLGWNAGKEVA